MNDLALVFQESSEFIATVRLNNGAPFKAIFEAAYVDALGVASATPNVTCRDADINQASIGSVLNINGTDYRIATIEPDGAGLSVLRVHALT